MRETLRQQAAKIRPSFRVVFASLIVLSIFPLIASSADNNNAAKREAVQAQFDRAEKARKELSRIPKVRALSRNTPPWSASTSAST